MATLDLRTGLFVAVVIGCLLGGLSVFGDPAGITAINALANAAAPWLVAAFAAGALQRRPRDAALTGLVALLTALAWYYGRWLGSPFFPTLLALAWLTLVVVTGPAFGIAGATWRIHSADRRSVLALGLLVGALLAEATHRLILLEAWDGLDLSRTYAQLALADTVLALALALGLGRNRRAEVLIRGAVLAVGWTAVLFGVDAMLGLLAGV